VRFSGPVTITLYASSDGSISSDDTVLLTTPLSGVRLRFANSKTVKLRYTYGDNLAAGSYFLIASMNADGTNTAPTRAVTGANGTGTAVKVVPATVDLATSFRDSPPLLVAPGQIDSTLVTIQNQGNVTAGGTISVSLYASADGTLGSSDTLLLSVPARKIRLAPGRSITFRLRFTAPAARAAGSYKLLASTVSAVNLVDANVINDVASISTV
jgi:hypothetical protein